MSSSMHTQSGKAFMEILQKFAIIAVVLFTLIVIVHWFTRVLFQDSVIEDTFKELTSRALSASTQMITQQGRIESSEFGSMTRQGYAAQTYPVDDGFFEITLEGVSKGVCSRLLKRNWSLPSSVYINGELFRDNPDMCQEQNQMSFEFSRDLQSDMKNAVKPRNSHCRSDSDCDGCSACRNGRCQSGCNEGESCALNLSGKSVCCSAQNQIGNLCCSYIEDNQCCWGRNRCCPKDHPLSLADGTCSDCYDRRVFGLGSPISAEICRTLCPNRVPFGSEGQCALPVCQADEFTGKDGLCHACSEVGGIATIESECGRCSNRSFSGGICSHPCPVDTVEDINHICQPCDTVGVIRISDPESCTKSCIGRQWQPTGCSLKTCPAGYVADRRGNCVSCQTPETIFNISPDICEQCPNRQYQDGGCQPICPADTFRAKDGRCVACRDIQAYPVQVGSNECLKCPERLSLQNYCFAPCGAGQFRDSYGACRSCLDLSSYPIPQSSSCSVCLNRTVLLRPYNGQVITYCAPQYCPIDYFADQAGTCYDCFLQQAVTQTDKEACEKCSNRFWSPVGDTCRIRQNCQATQIMDTTGVCHDCHGPEELIPVNGMEQNCDTCPNRYVYGYWCRLCPADRAVLHDRAGCEKCGAVWDNRTQKCTVPTDRE